MLDYMRKGDLSNFRYGQGRSQFNASSSILDLVLLRMQLKDFMDEQAKINRDTVTKFKAIDKVLENIDRKVTEVGSSNHQVLNMMKILEMQVGQLAWRLSANEGKLSGQPQGLEIAKAIQTHSGKETEDLEHSAGARNPMPSTEAEEFAKEEVTEIVTEEPEFEMPGEDTNIPQLKPYYFRGKLDNHFEKFVEVMRRLRIYMPLLDALKVPTYSRYFKYILANKCEIATLGADHVNMSKQCSTGREKQGDPRCSMIPCSVHTFKFEKALCDLGASVSVMPRDVFENLRLPKLEPMSMCLVLGDNSICYPLGIAVDVLVKVGHHFIHVDFVVLEMGEWEKPPLILGRPFLKTVGATIDVGKGEIKFDINRERSSFKFRPHFEVCNMIKVKYILPHHHISKEEPRKKEEPEKKKAKEIKEVVASIKVKEQKPPMKTQKMTKPKNKPAPKMVRKWVLKIATPAKSVDPK
jgi:predicted aspartyl protease